MAEYYEKPWNITVTDLNTNECVLQSPYFLTDDEAVEWANDNTDKYRDKDEYSIFLENFNNYV